MKAGIRLLENMGELLLAYNEMEDSARTCG